MNIFSPYKEWRVPELVDSISISLYKILGIPHPFGIVLTNEDYYDNGIVSFKIDCPAVKVAQSKNIFGIRNSFNTFLLLQTISELELHKENSIFTRIALKQLKFIDEFESTLREILAEESSKVKRHLFHISMPSTYVSE